MGSRYFPEKIFLGDPAEKFSIAIMGCQLMKRLSDNYPAKCMYKRQNFLFSGVSGRADQPPPS